MTFDEILAEDFQSDDTTVMSLRQKILDIKTEAQAVEVKQNQHQAVLVSCKEQLLLLQGKANAYSELIQERLDE